VIEVNQPNCIVNKHTRGGVMRKVYTLLLVTFVLLVSLSLVVTVSCNGNDDNGEQEEEEEEEEEGLSWADFPIYPGADRQYEAFFMFPQVEDEEYIMEWRYYRTDDSHDDVADFYKDEMPGYGWELMGYFDFQIYDQCIFIKNDGQDMAYAMAATDNGDTIIALIKGHEK
jgi:hypothetical protein